MVIIVVGTEQNTMRRDRAKNEANVLKVRLLVVVEEVVRENVLGAREAYVAERGRTHRLRCRVARRRGHRCLGHRRHRLLLHLNDSLAALATLTRHVLVVDVNDVPLI